MFPINALRLTPLLSVVLATALILFVARPAAVVAAEFNMIAPNVISIKGPIELDDCQRWTAALRPGIKYVMLNSPGGRVGQGECMSRSIFKLRLKTVVLGKCASICFLLFAAGAEKAACPGARVGVHRPADVVTKQESPDPIYLRIMLEHAQRYGVPDAILEKLSATPNREIYYLTDADLASMGAKTCA